MPPIGATLHPPCTLQQHWKKKKENALFLKKRDQVYAEKSKVKNAKMK
jgi:hypothetical protein